MTLSPDVHTPVASTKRTRDKEESERGEQDSTGKEESSGEENEQSEAREEEETNPRSLRMQPASNRALYMLIASREDRQYSTTRPLETLGIKKDERVFGSRIMPPKPLPECPWKDISRRIKRLAASIQLLRFTYEVSFVILGANGPERCPPTVLITRLCRTPTRSHSDCWCFKYSHCMQQGSSAIVVSRTSTLLIAITFRIGNCEVIVACKYDAARLTRSNFRYVQGHYSGDNNFQLCLKILHRLCFE